MRIFNVSYNDPKVERAVNSICGEAFGFWASIRMGGTGSQRFQLMDGPAELLELVDRMEDRRFASLELRTGGLLFRFRNRLEALAVPLAWNTLAEVRLGTTGASSTVDLRVRSKQGGQLHFRMNREQHTALDRLLRKALPAGVPYA